MEVSFVSAFFTSETTGQIWMKFDTGGLSRTQASQIT